MGEPAMLEENPTPNHENRGEDKKKLTSSESSGRLMEKVVPRRSLYRVETGFLVVLPSAWIRPKSVQTSKPASIAREAITMASNGGSSDVLTEARGAQLIPIHTFLFHEKPPLPS
jgi:hypothetical protein